MIEQTLPAEFSDNLRQLLAYARAAVEQARTNVQDANALRACEEHLRKVEYLIERWTGGNASDHPVQDN